MNDVIKCTSLKNISNRERWIIIYNKDDDAKSKTGTFKKLRVEWWFYSICTYVSFHQFGCVEIAMLTICLCSVKVYLIIYFKKNNHECEVSKSSFHKLCNKK